MSAGIAGPAGLLRVDDGGRGDPAVVFVHSLAGRAAHWSAVLERLRPAHRAVAFDLRGHGGSAAPDDPAAYAVEALAGDVAAVTDGLGLGRFALVGHSLGGGVALAYAGAHPTRVERLLLLDPIGDGTHIPRAELQPFLDRLDSPDYENAIETYWRTIAGPDSGVGQRLLRDLRDTPRRVVVAGFTAAMGFDPHPALAGFRGPVLAVITPSNDFPFSLHRVAGMPHRVVEGTGHWIQLDRPEEFGEILQRFLRGQGEG